MPYAEAMVYEQAAINLCPPGGVKTLEILGEILQKDPEVYREEMQAKAKNPSLVSIREAECIGCTKCIQVCPVDAIIGSAKQMHTVIASACTGCDLCIPACPVDCIDIIQLSNQENQADQWRERFQKREQRLVLEKEEKEASKQAIHKQSQQEYIHNALARAKQKRG